MPTLSWLTREKDVKSADAVAYRLLERDDALSFGDPASGNMLIQGDNLEALKSLLPYYRGQVKCIYIDPPYNTRSAFEHYDDNLEHSQWLAMIWPRLVLLRELLAEDGSIWVSIDDNEGHYLKVIMDEVFGRRNFIASNIWQKRYSRENREAIGDVHEYLMVYAKSPEAFKASRNRIPLDEQQAKIYKNPDNSKETDPAKRWRGLPMTAQGFRPNQMYVITAPNGTQHRPPEGRCWSMIEPEFEKLKARGRIYWGKDGKAQPSGLIETDDSSFGIPTCEFACETEACAPVSILRSHRRTRNGLRRSSPRVVLLRNMFGEPGSFWRRQRVLARRRSWRRRENPSHACGAGRSASWLRASMACSGTRAGRRGSPLSIRRWSTKSSS